MKPKTLQDIKENDLVSLIHINERYSEIPTAVFMAKKYHPDGILDKPYWEMVFVNGQPESYWSGSFELSEINREIDKIIGTKNDFPELFL